MPFGTLALKCDCCTPCDCRVCLTIQGCGTGITADFGVYTAAGCTGSPIATGSYDGTTPECVCLPSSGSYYVQVTPTGDAAGVYRPHCYLLSVTDDDCAGEKDVTYYVAKYKYQVNITVGGVYNKYFPGDEFSGPGWVPCPLWAGISVSYTDGTNTVSGTTDSDGQIVFTDLDVPADIETLDATWSISLSGFPAHSGWTDTTISYTLTYGGTCFPLDLCVVPDTASGYVWTPVCNHPLPKVLSLTWSGTTVSLTNPDTVPTLVTGFHGNCVSLGDRAWYGKWLGCSTISCTGTSKVAATASCSGLGDPLGPCDPRFYAWSETTGSVPTWFMLFSHYDLDGSTCDDPVLWTLYASTWVTSSACPGDFLDPHPCLSVWVATSATTQESRSVDCSFTLTNSPPSGESYPYVCNTATLSVLSASWTEDICDPTAAFSLSDTLGSYWSCGGGDFEITG